MPAKKIDGDGVISTSEKRPFELLAAIAHEARPVRGARE